MKHTESGRSNGAAGDGDLQSAGEKKSRIV